MLKYKRSFFRLSYLVSIFIILLIGIMVYRNNLIYDGLSIKYDNKTVKYGNKITGADIVRTSNAPYRIVQDIDTNKLGEQEILVEISKENVTKIIPISVTVVDETKPVIAIENESIGVIVGNSFDIKNNITSVTDDDVPLEYKEQATAEDREYYTINGSVDFNAVGTYEIEVIAVDRVNNTSSVKFNVVVEEVPAPVATNYSYGDTVGNAPVNVVGGSLASIAYSLVGNPYVSGGNRPGGFDCSGFVQYVYAAAGKSISRSSYTQAYDGVGISYSNAQPGDILIWGHGSSPSHTAIYVGNGQMVHATNPRQGVIVSGVDYWNTHSDARLIGVRRVN